MQFTIIQSKNQFYELKYILTSRLFSVSKMQHDSWMKYTGFVWNNILLKRPSFYQTINPGRSH